MSMHLPGPMILDYLSPYKRVSNPESKSRVNAGQMEYHVCRRVPGPGEFLC